MRAGAGLRPMGYRPLLAVIINPSLHDDQQDTGGVKHVQDHRIVQHGDNPILHGVNRGSMGAAQAW